MNVDFSILSAMSYFVFIIHFSSLSHSFFPFLVSFMFSIVCSVRYMCVLRRFEF